MLQEQITQDLKTALLAGNATEVSVLRSLKSAIIYAEVARGIKGVSSLSDQEIVDVLRRESKKRRESAELFIKGGAPDRADKELSEQLIIDRYLPTVLSKDEVNTLVDKAMQEFSEITPQTMGRIIGRVKELSNGAADGGVVASIVKERMGE